MSTSPAAASVPRAWKYVLAAVILLTVLIPVWTLVVMLVIEPPSMMQEQTMGKRLLWWVAGPVLVVAGLVGWRWQVASANAQAPEARTTIQVQTAPIDEQARREYVLEVIGLGVTLDKYRQGALWEQLAKGHPYVTIRERDPKKYPWSADEKDGIEGLRSGDTLENGAKSTPMYWGVPTFAAVSPADDPKRPTSPTDPALGIPAAAGSSDMTSHLFVAAGWELSERPDRLLERVFSFFDENPDVPYVVLSAADGLYFRNLYRPKDTPPFVKDGYYIPEMPDSSALLVLARRERVDAVRPFAFEDANHIKLNSDELNRRGVARRLFLAYIDLSEAVPKPKDYPRRPPTTAEWLTATHAFTQRDDIYPKTFSPVDMALGLVRHHPPREFKPTPWFPLPWNKDQLATFDLLPSLGYLHRPVFVRTVDAEGKPLTRRDARAAALAAGWQQALLTLPEAERKAAPARVVVSAGGNVDQTIAFSSALAGWAEQGGAEVDKSRPERWIDTDARLGNTGAATWFVQMAVGVMGSYRQGGASVAVNLRDPAEASIVFVTPPSEDKRKSQQHPRGDDVFRHRVAPAIDPANYGQK